MRHFTRRQFVAVGAVGGAAIAIGCAARQENWDFLSDNQARTLAAICDQIIPADDYPSASQAGVLTFIDRQLNQSLRRFRGAYRHGLEHAEAISWQRFARELAALTPVQQAEVVGAMERDDHDFFELVRDHTLNGYYGAPRHGGNRNAVSWRMLGLAEPLVRGRALYDLTRGSAS